MAGDDDVVQVTSSVAVPRSELRWKFSRSGGPGGQHANTADTRVELRFDIAGSPSLSPGVRARLVERLGHEIRVVADDERSQARNRELAIARLRGRLAEALRVRVPRRPTRPGKGAVERRLEEKRRQAQRKQERRKPEGF